MNIPVVLLTLAFTGGWPSVAAGQAAKAPDRFTADEKGRATSRALTPETASPNRKAEDKGRVSQRAVPAEPASPNRIPDDKGRVR